MLTIKLVGGQELIERLRTKGPKVAEAAQLQMTRSMIDVQGHIVEETLPQFFEDGGKGIAPTIRAYPATQVGAIIRGEVYGGGPETTKETLGGPNAGTAVDYALVQEEGVAHSWEINPVLYGIAWSTSRDVKDRALKGVGADIGGLPRALAFQLGGAQVIVRRVIHPPLRARPFMLAGLQDMAPKIVADLQTAVTKAIAE